MITVIGDLVVDIIVQKDGNNYATDTASTISTNAGGQANHVAAWIASSNEGSTLIGRVGKDLYGDFLVKEAKQLGVHLAIEKDLNLETGKIILLIDELTGERSMYTDRGANERLSIEQINQNEQIIKNSKCLYLSGYTLFSANTREAAIRAKDIAIKNNVPIAVDPSSTYFLKQHKQQFLDFIQTIDFLFPNLEEGALLTGEKEPELILKRLKQVVKHPVLKLGKSGSMFFHNQEIVHHPAEEVKAIDTTGAGDAYIGAFLANWIRSHHLNDSARFATKIAAKAVQNVGGRPAKK